MNRQLISFILLVAFLFSTLGVKAYSEDEGVDIGISLRGPIWYGKASWYGGRFHGRNTSNGETYNKRKLTAAHRTLPFNTYVMVTNLKNNKSVIVRINDRGPLCENRIIDLSEEAANMIDSREQGIAQVKLQVLPNYLEN